MLRLAFIATLFALLPATADAAVFRGETSQGRAVVVRTNAADETALVRISWRAACADGTRYRDRTDFRSPFDDATRRQVIDRGTYTAKDPGGLRFRVKVALRLERRGDTRRRGTFRASAVVRRRGKFVTRCKLRTGVRAQRV